MRLFSCAAALLCAAVGSTTATAALRFFFSEIGAAPDESVLDANPGLTLPIPRSNPDVPSGSRLYLWGEMTGAPGSQAWVSLDLGVSVVGGNLTARQIYNYQRTDSGTGDVLYRRWDGVNQGWIDGNGDVQSFTAFATSGGAGISNTAAAANYDLQSEVGMLQQLGFTGTQARSLTQPAGWAGKAVLLGWFDVALESGQTQAEVFLKISGAIVRSGGGVEPIYLGVGDENAGLTGGSLGQMSPVADATITPEPALGGALLLAGLLLRRR